MAFSKCGAGLSYHLALALGMPQKICTKKSQTQGLLTLCQEKSYTSQVNCSNKGYLIQGDGTPKYLACVSAKA
jgi:hypothetical protein